MNKTNMKNMVILRDLPSNLVEEALLVLKPNIKLKNLDLIETRKEGKNKTEDNSKKYIIDEAQMIVSNYLSKIEKQNSNQVKVNKKIEKKYKKARLISIILAILLFLSFLT